MKLEKFRKLGKKKITIISTIILVFVLMLGIIIYESYALYEEKKSFNVLNGTVPVFGGKTSAIELAFTVNGEESLDEFPDKESGYIAKNVTCDNGVNAHWNNIEWGLILSSSNKNKKIKCTIDFIKKKIEVYGIERALNSNSSAWTRTNDAIGKVANAQFGSTAVQNDFDNIYPWSEIKSYNYNILSSSKITAWYGDSNFKFDGTNGEVLTYIPEFYYQRYKDGTKEYIEISKEYIEGFTKSEAFSVGRYTISGSSAGVHSKSGVIPLVNTTITDFRNYSKALSENFGQMDYHYFILQLLYLVEYADYNNQAKLGTGNTNSNGVIVQSGGCNDLGMKSGTINNDGKHSMIYRGIEDLYGNIYQFIDGINIKDRQVYICYDQSKYVTDTFTGCYKKIGYINANENGYIKQLGYDPNNPLIAFPTSVGGNENTYITDYYYQSVGNKILAIGGISKLLYSNGIWYMDYEGDSTFKGDNAGARLIKIN